MIPAADVAEARLQSYVNSLFGYTAVIDPNAGPHRLELPCARRNWGLCCADATQGLCSTGSKNLHQLLVRAKVPPTELPLMLTLSIPRAEGQAPSRTYLLAKSFNKGETHLLMHLAQDEGSELWWVAMDATATATVTTAQLVLRDMLLKDRPKEMANATDVLTMKAQLHKLQNPGDDAASFQFKKGKERMSADLPLRGALLHRALDPDFALPLGLVMPAVDEADGDPGDAGDDEEDGELKGVEVDDDAASSHTASEKAPGDGDADPVLHFEPPLPPPPEPPRIGIMRLDKAPAARQAKCQVCGMLIPHHHIRAVVRAAKASFDQFVHNECVSTPDFPDGWVLPSLVRLRAAGELEDPDLNGMKTALIGSLQARAAAAAAASGLGAAASSA